MTDPYAPPPRHRDRSGALLRVVIIAALLGVGVWGYTAFQANEQSASLVPVEEQQLADSGYTASPTPEAETTAPAATPAPAPAPASREERTAPAPTPAPAEPVPPPSTTLEPAPMTPPA